MKRISTVLLIAISLLAFSCKSDKSQTSSVEEQPRIEPVRVMRLDYQSIARSVEHSSNLMAFEEIHLAPASPGRIENIFVEVGTRVSKGQVLVQMDRTQLHQAEVQLRLLEADFKRLDTLQKVGSIPQQQYDQLKAQVEITRTNVEFLRQNTRMHAPFSGVVAAKYFEPGEMFTGAPNTQVGKAAVLTLVQTNKLKAMIQISERFIPFIRHGMEVSLRADVYPDEVFVGRVFRIHPTVNPLTRTFAIEIEVPNSAEKLRPGMFSRAAIDLQEVQAFVAPSLAVMKLQGSNDRFVFLEKDGKAQRVSVETGQRFDENVELITDKIKPGDRLIIAGQSRLLDGVAVSVQQ